MVEISCLTICMPLYKNYGRNDPRAKQPTGETTHVIRANRPTPKIRANRPTPKTRAKRPRAKRPGETTNGETTRIPLSVLLQTSYSKITKWHNSCNTDPSAPFFLQNMHCVMVKVWCKFDQNWLNTFKVTEQRC